jgi:hypothetical protein
MTRVAGLPVENVRAIGIVSPKPADRLPGPSRQKDHAGITIVRGSQL